MKRILCIFALALALTLCLSAAALAANYPYVTTTGTIDPSKDFTVAWESVDGVERYLVIVNSTMLGQETYSVETQNTSITLPASAFADGSPMYSIYVRGYMAQNGYRGSSADFFASYTPDSRVTVTTAKTDLLVNEEFSFTVSSSGASEIGYFDNEGPWDNETSNTVTTSYSYSWPGEYRIWGRAMIDGQWTQCSEPLVLNVTSNGELNEFEVTVQDTDLGSPVIVKINALDENVDYYTIDIYDENSNYISRVWDITPQQMLEGYPIDSGLFDVGEYSISVNAVGAPGWIRTSADATFTVSGELPEGPQVTSSADHYEVGESMRFTITDSKATQLRWKGRFEDAEGNRLSSYGLNTMSFNGQNTIGLNADEGGCTFIFMASVYKDGGWTAFTECRVTIGEALGTLAAPSVGLPASVELGTTVTITLGEVENAGMYYVRVNTENDRYEIRSYETAGAYDITDMLDYGTNTVAVWVTQNKYISSNTVVKTLTVTGDLPDAPQVALSKQTMTINDQIVATANADGATEFQFIWEVRRADGRTQTRSIVETEEADANGSCSYSFWPSDTWHGMTFVIKARALIDGVWSKWSEEQIASIADAPELDAPDVTMPDTIAAGDLLTVTVGEVENAQYYNIDISNYVDDRYEWVGSEWMEDAGSMLITKIVDPGTYRLIVYARADGYVSGRTTRVLTVTEGELADPPVLTVPETEYSLGETINYTVTLDGARTFFVVGDMYNSDGSLYSSNFISDALAPQEEGYASNSCYVSSWMSGKTIELRAYASINGKLTQKTEPVIISIKEADKLAAPAAHFESDTIQAGECPKLVIEGSENAEYYEAEAIQNGGSAWYYFGDTGTHDFILPLDPGTYTVNVYAYGQNVITSDPTALTLTVTGEMAQGPQVSTQSAESPANTNFSVTALQEGAEEFFLRTEVLNANGSVYSPNYNRYSFAADEGRGTTSMWADSYLIGRTFKIYVRAKVNGLWTAESEPVSVLITEPEPLKVPTLSVHEPEVYGEDLIITVGSAGGASYYEIKVYDSNNTYAYNDTVSTPGTYSVYGWNLTSGETYTVEVVAGNYNDPDVQATYTFTMPEQESASNRCGENVYWEMNGGTLHIYGSGDMFNYYGEETPWAGENILWLQVDEGVTRIGGYAFMGCSSLSSALLPDSVTRIGSYAFSGCGMLTNITLPNQLNKLGSYVFEGCPIAILTLPPNLYNISSTAFDHSGITALLYTDFTMSGNVAGQFGIPAFSLNSNMLTLPAMLTEIEAEAFANLSVPMTVRVPSAVTAIAESAFQNSTVLFRCSYGSEAERFAQSNGIPIIYE